MSPAVADGDVLNVLRDGANRLCDHAIEQWRSGKYGLDENAVRMNVDRWNAIRERAGELVHELKDARRGKPTKQ